MKKIANTLIALGITGCAIVDGWGIYLVHASEESIPMPEKAAAIAYVSLVLTLAGGILRLYLWRKEKSDENR